MWMTYKLNCLSDSIPAVDSEDKEQTKKEQMRIYEEEDEQLYWCHFYDEDTEVLLVENTQSTPN